MGPYVFFFVATGMWVAFGLALAARPVLLDRARAGVRRLPLVAKPVVWIVFLPWLGGLAIWESGWRTAPRAPDRRPGRGTGIHRVLVVGDSGRGHVAMSTAAARPQQPSAAARLLAQVSFGVMAGGWTAFLIALVASPQTLDDLWTAVADLPLVLEGVASVLGFPFLVGLAIWQASWAEALRLIAIAVLAIAYTYMFRPRPPAR
jgi:hypothetical protein